MRRRLVLTQLAIFAVISALVLWYAVFSLLDVKVTNRPFTVTVHLKTAGGIFDGAEVSYRGVMVGRVSSVQLHTSEVVVKLAIDHGNKIPDNAVANVFDLSAVGEQYVDLVPTAPSTSYLRNGSVIPADRTTTPLQTATVLYDLERFVDSINPTDVQIIGSEGAAAFGGTGQQLKTLLTDATTIIKQLSTTETAAVDLIRNSAALLHSAAAHASDFDTFAVALNDLTTTIARSTPTLTTFFGQAPANTALFDTLIRQTAPAVGVLLGNLATLSDIQVARVPGLRSLLVAVPEFGTLAPSVVQGDTLLGAGNINQTEPLCPTGVPMTSPISDKRTPVQDVRCSLGILQRGVGNAPRPGGSATASALATANGVQVGSYDASSGLTSSADGSQLRLGTNGGQYQVLGDNSWQAMLLAVTGG